MVFENKNNISEISRFVLKDKRVFRNLQVLDKFRLHLVLYLVFNDKHDSIKSSCVKAKILFFPKGMKTFIFKNLVLHFQGGCEYENRENSISIVVQLSEI